MIFITSAHCAVFVVGFALIVFTVGWAWPLSHETYIWLGCACFTSTYHEKSLMFEMNVMAMYEMIIVIIIIHRKEMHEWFIVYRDNDQYAHFAIKTFITSSTCSLIDPIGLRNINIYIHPCTIMTHCGC